MKNKLNVTTQDGVVITINVLDIIDSKVFNKSFIIYTLEGENETIFGSILNEDEENVTFETITNKEEIDFINSEIDRVASELV